MVRNVAVEEMSQHLLSLAEDVTYTEAEHFHVTEPNLEYFRMNEGVFFLNKVAATQVDLLFIELM